MSLLVSCILPTYNRRDFIAQSVRYFLRQDYPNKELLILDDGSDCVRDLIPDDPQIHYTRLDRRHTIGTKRNLACAQASGEIIVHWDDDDWMAPWRVSYQVAQLQERNLDLCGLDRLYYYQPSSENGWEYIYPGASRPWVAGNTLCYLKRAWQQHRFPEIDVSEDARFVWQLPPKRVGRLENSGFIVGLIHPTNVSPKVTAGPYWHPRPAARIFETMGADASFYSSKALPPPDRPAALVAAARGIGDILRATPLIKAMSDLGYAVDFLIEPDYAEAAELFEGLPEIRKVYFRTPAHAGPPKENLSGLDQQHYDVAAFTWWSASLQSLVRTKRTLCFDRGEWLRKGDPYCVARIAGELGWNATLPAPIAAASGRQFDLPPGTIAIHPGCKPDWPWKKWHGFDELARLIPEVVIVGTESDLQNQRTYFRQPFQWPEHARNFIGALNLRDTAALIQQCAALVSNDSGLMHLGVALGTPTVGIFGITDPLREAMPATNMFPITKGLPCEPACRTRAFGQRDCEHHLKCLRTFTPEEVLDRVESVRRKPQAPVRVVRKELPVTPKVTLAYHGHVFDSTGYGQAARGYIHALHHAGVELSVTDLSGHARQVRDPLVESLVDRRITPDFHLFHGIPSIWSREVFRHSNAIGMTVWETDTMPTQWRNTLNHLLEVWLPCDYNVRTFEPRLSKPVFKLPHVTLPRAGASPPQLRAGVRIHADDFVFYSIFEWQDRKCPLGQLIAYLRAFPDDGPHVFVLKSNPGARDAARSALEEARRQTGSSARVETHCDGWSDGDIDALHQRGDCYVSLHRGEGWCLPLFDAACHGTPVVATAYSGPLEYLQGTAHQLVPYTLTSVRQPYVFYNQRMQWAEPDLDEATRRLRWVYDNRETARSSAHAAAAPLRRRYAPEAIGELARERLFELLRRRDRPRWEQFRSSRSAALVPPPQPIPGEWYDADYFEHGVKSNWTDGYHWPAFQGLFRDTASFINSLFPDAESIVDAGCAKGFLVKSLRNSGKNAWGFDASPWAIRNAVEGTQGFLQLAAAESVKWDQSFDLTLAFDLFSHLTEEQAVAALAQARAFTKVAMMAVIHMGGDARAATDRDLSHITLKDRLWWHDLFVRSGWRKDGLHEVVERACQRHPLPAKMGWQIFLYSPV